MTSPFVRFHLEALEPAWSSAALEAAIEAALSGASADDLLRGVFELLGERADLTPTHAHFIRDFVKACVLRLGADLGSADRGWAIPTAPIAPGQALLAVYVAPQDRLDPEAVRQLLTSLEGSAFFDEAVIELQDAAVRSEVARHLFATKPELAKRVRAVLTR